MAPSERSDFACAVSKSNYAHVVLKLLSSFFPLRRNFVMAKPAMRPTPAPMEAIEKSKPAAAGAPGAAVIRDI